MRRSIPHCPPITAPAVLLALAVVAGVRAEEASGRPSAAGDRIADEVFELVQEQREQKSVPRFTRNEVLDRVAAERAAHVAALPHSERLAVNEPIGERVQAAGIRFYRNVTMHLDMQRGYRFPASAFFRNWQKHGSWDKVLDPRFEAIGLGTARGADDWIVLVAVLLDELNLPTDIEELTLRTVDAINARREESGLPPLRPVDTLARVALGHSRDMADRGYFAHRSPEGHHVDDRATEAGVSFRVIGENIYRCFGIEDPVAAAVEGWMKSRSHRDNILDPRFEQTGMGIFVDEDGNYFFTQVFAAQ